MILLLFLLVILFHYSRWTLSEDKAELPALLLYRSDRVIVAVESDDDPWRRDLYQLNRTKGLMDVTILTGSSSLQNGEGRFISGSLLRDGEVFKVVNSSTDFKRSIPEYIAATHRILLQIPLHPDRMSLGDWCALPGIGIKMAQNIENDRQQNGDFGQFFALKRVKGIGSKKLDLLADYFQSDNRINENKLVR